MRSMMASTALTSRGSALRLPERTSASTSSAAWLRDSSRGRSKTRISASCPRPIEEAAIALHRVDEAEDRVEPGAVVGLGLPSDDLTAQCLEHLAGFGDEFVDQVFHGAPSERVRRALWRRVGKGDVYRRLRYFVIAAEAGISAN